MATRKNPRVGTIVKEGHIVGRGDNRTVIDPDEVYKLAKLWCTNTEIAEWFGVPVATIEYNFAEIIAKGKSETKQALRRAQLGAALGGNVTMLIWLGKNILGQREPGSEAPAAIAPPSSITFEVMKQGEQHGNEESE